MRSAKTFLCVRLTSVMKALCVDQHAFDHFSKRNISLCGLCSEDGLHRECVHSRQAYMQGYRGLYRSQVRISDS